MVASVATRATSTNASCGIDHVPWAFQLNQGDVQYVESHHGAKSL